ncbi:unnamed protein product [Prunus armeniaca]|uniref:Uncharacterized protein n=1 Tax=Prunus armeniaca TaxID=36596 RepID=A0A6J5TW67_PRUAR|nr:unnamed protein product [Prunus armeniaca]
MRPQTTVQYVPRKANGTAHRLAHFCLRELAYHFGWMSALLDYSWIAFKMIVLLCIPFLDSIVLTRPLQYMLTLLFLII